MGDQRQMAPLDLESPGAHALCHEALEVRIDGAILRRDGVIARLRAPGCVRRLAGEQRPTERLLHSIEHLRLLLRKVASKVAQEGCLRKTSLIPIEHDAG